MNFFKRAMASVTRRKGKSLILFAVIFILGNVMAGAIAIDQGTKSVEGTIKKKLGSVATVTNDFDKIDEAMKNDEKSLENAKYPTSKTAKEIGKLDEVSFYDYSIQESLFTEKLKMYQPKGQEYMMLPEGTNYFQFKGINYNEVYDIKNKIITLSDGRVFDKEEVTKGKPVVLISEEMAKTNNLRAGDKMIIDSLIQEGDPFMGGMSSSDGEESSKEGTTKKIKKDIQVEVIGTFKVLKAEKSKKEKNDNSMSEMNYIDRSNTIYAPNDFVSKTIKMLKTTEFDEFPQNFGDQKKDDVLKSLESNFGISSTYTLKSPEVAEDFRIKANQILEKENIKFNKVLISSDQYDQVAGPVKGMSKISKLVLIISVLASILIITLVTILFLRDRKHELGIYLALGEKRSKVIGQIVLEVVTVAIVAITISVFTGNILANNFSNSLIQTQKTEQNANNFNPQDFEFAQLTNNNVSEEDVIEAYQISLNATYVILFYIVGIGVILVSTVAPLIYIMRLNPKKIMM